MKKRDFIKCSLMGFGGVCLLNKTALAEKNKLWLANSDKLWKWSKEGLFYSPTPRGTKCLICPNECTIKPNEYGTCRNRTNFGDKLFTIAYGNPCAVHVDPIEKKPFFHFLPTTNAYSIATAGCNLACLNCQNWEISQSSPKDTSNADIMPEDVVNEALNNNCKSIAYTYSEPITFYEYTYDTSKIAKSKNIKNVLVTAGYVNEEPLRNLCKVIDAATMDIKSFSDDLYMKLNGGKLDPILRSLKIFAEEKVWLEISNLIVPGWTDNSDMIKRMCEWFCTNNLSGYPLHFLRFYPQYKLTQLPSTPVNTLIKARETAIAAGMKFVYIGNVPGSNGENTYCPKCKKLLIERKGFSILQNHIKNNSCEYCGEKIPGIWN